MISIQPVAASLRMIRRAVSSESLQALAKAALSIATGNGREMVGDRGIKHAFKRASVFCPKFMANKLSRELYFSLDNRASQRKKPKSQATSGI